MGSDVQLSSSGGHINIENDLNGGGHNLSVSANSTTLDGSNNTISGINSLSIAGDANLSGILATTGDQIYEYVNLIADSTLTSEQGSINISGISQNSARMLTLGD